MLKETYYMRTNGSIIDVTEYEGQNISIECLVKIKFYDGKTESRHGFEVKYIPVQKQIKSNFPAFFVNNKKTNFKVKLQKNYIQNFDLSFRFGVFSSIIILLISICTFIVVLSRLKSKIGPKSLEWLND